MLIAHSIAIRRGGSWTAQALEASSFCTTWRAQRDADRAGALFVKSLPLARAKVLEAEADGLAALAQTGTVRVPAVVECWRDARAGLALLALEWLDLRAPDAGFGARLGRALAALHRTRPAPADGRYGWRRDNMLGATLQRNRWSGDTQDAPAGWIEFFGRERLGALCERLAARGVDSDPEIEQTIRLVRAVIDALPTFFADGYRPRPSLIHGDLWSGNWGMRAGGEPVIYDPAVSISDAEAELAMMELFGRPPEGFWSAYRESMPVHEGYTRRRGLYQLYHLLNHALLFGGGYLQQSAALAHGLLRSIGAGRAA